MIIINFELFHLLSYMSTQNHSNKAQAGYFVKFCAIVWLMGVGGNRASQNESDDVHPLSDGTQMEFSLRFSCRCFTSSELDDYVFLKLFE